MRYKQDNRFAEVIAVDAISRHIDLARRIDPTLRFTLLEVGAVPLADEPEAFHRILTDFPGSEIIAFEVDADLCAKLNSQAPHGMRYFPMALGRSEERRPFYLTAHPMCASLYKPDQPLISLYQNLEVAYATGETSLKTVSLDYFCQTNDIRSVDFIKIDIQGAELDVFEGGSATLRDTLAIVSEVEFIPLYEEQPLFGDVCSFLTKHSIMFHKFLGLAGRALRPIVLNNDANFPSQHMWSDALFVRDVRQLQVLHPQQLLKLSVLSFLYGSFDLAYFCLDAYDRQNSTQWAPQMLGG
jgi:FkbM family methyltransferase